MKVVSVVFEDKAIIGDEKKLENAIMDCNKQGNEKGSRIRKYEDAGCRKRHGHRPRRDDGRRVSASQVYYVS
jgi:hypothetical protein